MTLAEQKYLAYELLSFSVFNALTRTETVSSLTEFLLAEDERARSENYGRFVSSLSKDGYCLTEFLRRALFADENPYIAAIARGEDVPEIVENNARSELCVLSKLTHLSTDSLWEGTFDRYVPGFGSFPADLAAEYDDRLRNIGKYGYGVFAGSIMFRLAGDEIVPVKAADVISEDCFIGYDRERAKVFDNTRALIDGKPAANILLYGDAGTGKSSTVKACANRFAPAGVRLIELRKDQLFSLPDVMGRIMGNPLKFIIFIDDLSFNKNDDSFSMLKAALEGSASMRADNAVIYATSNRRHIVKESFSDREGDDVHRKDTMQELMSLSDRFGLTVYFEKPDKRLYLEIVHTLAEKSGIAATPAIDTEAEAFALRKGGRTPRAAEQFVDSLLSK